MTISKVHSCPQCQPIWAGPSKRSSRCPRGPMLQASKCCHISAWWGAGVGVGGRDWGLGVWWAFLTPEATHLLGVPPAFLTVDVSRPKDMQGVGSAAQLLGTPHPNDDPTNPHDSASHTPVASHCPVVHWPQHPQTCGPFLLLLSPLRAQHQSSFVSLSLFSVISVKIAIKLGYSA